MRLQFAPRADHVEKMIVCRLLMAVVRVDCRAYEANKTATREKEQAVAEALRARHAKLKASPPLVDATAQACVEQKQALVDCYRDAQAGGGGPGACKDVAEVFLACSRKARAAKVGQDDEGQGDEGRAAKVDGAAAG